MGNNIDLELKVLLENINNSYDDFVRAVPKSCRTDEGKQKMIDFINDCDNPTVSKVLDFLADEIWPMFEIYV